MAKKKNGNGKGKGAAKGASTALTVADKATALAKLPEDSAARLMPGRLAKFDAEDYEVPALHLFQDVGKESEAYGDHKKGVWVDAISLEEIEDPIIIPVMGDKSTEVWWSYDSKDGDGFIKRYLKRAEVEPMYLEDETKYSVMDVITWFVYVAGRDMPYAIRFKVTSLRAGKSLNTAERARTAALKMPGRYVLTQREVSNDKGKWFTPVITPNGDPTEDQLKTAVSYYNMLFGSAVKITIVDPGDGGQPTDDIPF